MHTVVHKENYDAYVERKRIIHYQGVLLKEIDVLKGKEKSSRAGDQSSGKSHKSDKTISYNKWNCDIVDWGAFSEVTSQSSTSNVDKKEK